MHKVRMSVNENRLSDPARIGFEDYRALLDGAGRGWVFEIEGAIVGFAVGDHGRRNIWALFVAPGYERRGIGRALHERMVRWLFEQGRDPLWLTTEPGSRAERFYRAAGWEARGEAPGGEMRFELQAAAAGAIM
jgi:GNAT superfamily N-acetyltransferase